jgi:putative flippase GtrA
MQDTAAVVRRGERNVLLVIARRLVALLPKAILRFLTVGVGGLAVDIAVLWLVKEHVGLNHALARLVSLSVATVVTWALNRQFTFGESGCKRRIEFGRYVAVAATAQSINYLSYLGLVASLPHVDYRLAALAGAVIATGFSYTGHRFFTFAARGPQDEPGDHL